MSKLETYGQELVAAGFEVWLTWTAPRRGEYDGYLQYRDPQTGCTGSLQPDYFGGWAHYMPLVPSRTYGSAMHIEHPLPVWTVDAARQCASPMNFNRAVGATLPNARDKQWRSDKAVALHGRSL